MNKREIKETLEKDFEPGYKFAGSILRLLRKDAKMTAKSLGKRVGRSGATISAWEAGAYAPSVDNIRALAQYFGLRPSDFILK